MGRPVVKSLESTLKFIYNLILVMDIKFGVNLSLSKVVLQNNELAGADNVHLHCFSFLEDVLMIFSLF